MKILAIDVGVGTQDTLLFDSDMNMENNIKLVSPSQTKILASKISQSKNNLIFTGETMGGGPISSAIIKHMKKGFKVVMTKNSARTVNDNLKKVAELGIEIIDENEASEFKAYEHLETRDVDFDLLTNLMENFGVIKDIDFVGVAVQDHGYSEGKSDRTFRFERIKKILEKGGGLKDFAYKEPPAYLTRMTSTLKDAKKHFDNVITVDTKIAAIAGTLHGVTERPIISIDIGNGHTLGALIDKESIGMFEHHTSQLTADKLDEMLEKLANGTLKNEDVFNDWGHGCYVKGNIGMRNVSNILATGPNRDMLKTSKLRVEFANPAGDVMMTGPVGIVDIIMDNFI